MLILIGYYLIFKEILNGKTIYISTKKLLVHLDFNIHSKEKK